MIFSESKMIIFDVFEALQYLLKITIKLKLNLKQY